MIDPLILSLTKQISVEGLTDETINKLMYITDTLLNIDDINSINITNTQTLLLLLQDFDINPVAKRLVNELRYKLIRTSIQNQTMDDDSVIINNYTTSVMNRGILEKIYDVNVTKNGNINIDTTFSLQPNNSVDETLLNDFAILALNDYNLDEKEIILSIEKFEIPRVGCCGMIRTDMIYPIGDECTEESFIKEALSLVKTYKIGSDYRTADTYSIEYFKGRPMQNLRESGNSLYLFELMSDGLWHYFKNGIEVFAESLDGVESTWDC